MKNYKEVDKGIKNLIKEMNKVGLKTVASCDGHHKARGWVTLNMKDISIQIKDDHLVIAWDIE